MLVKKIRVRALSLLTYIIKSKQLWIKKKINMKITPQLELFNDDNITYSNLDAALAVLRTQALKFRRVLNALSILKTEKNKLFKKGARK